MTNLLNVSIELAQSSDLTREAVDKLTRNLLSEIRADIKPASAELAMEDAPLGTKAADVVTVGAIVLALAPVIVDKLIDLLVDWSRRNKGHKVTIAMPVGRTTITIEYNPAHMKPEQLKREVAKAIAAVKTHLQV